jgi:hypothetical protein
MVIILVGKGVENTRGTRMTMRENQNEYGRKKRMQRIVSRILCVRRRNRSGVAAAAAAI